MSTTPYVLLQHSPDDLWSCSACTYNNKPEFNECEICRILRYSNQQQTIKLQNSGQQQQPNLIIEEPQSADVDTSCCKRLLYSKTLIVTGLIGQMILSLTPLVDVITDTLTIYLYYTHGDIHWFIIALLIGLYSMRNQFLFYMIISQYSGSPNPIAWLCTYFLQISIHDCPSSSFLYLIPWCGTSCICCYQCSLGDEKYFEEATLWRKFGCMFLGFTVWGILAELMYWTIGVIFGIIIIIMSVWDTLKKNVYFLIKICRSELLSPPKNYDERKDEERQKLRHLILKFIEALTESLPQMILQIYVFINTKTYSDDKHLILFCLSVVVSAISMLRLIIKVITNWKSVIGALTVPSFDESA